MRAASATDALRSEIESFLERADWEGLKDVSRRDSRVVRLLIAMSYDRESLTSWRAMDAIGRISADMPEDKVRNLIQRLLWMMREESGSNPWSAGQIISEIIRNNPSPFEDVVPIIISFHDEAILRTGSLWCMIRVGESRPDLVAPFAGVAAEYLGAGEPSDKGLAVLALGAIRDSRHIPLLERLKANATPVTYYDGDALVSEPLGEIASKALSRIKGHYHP